MADTSCIADHCRKLCLLSKKVPKGSVGSRKALWSSEPEKVYLSQPIQKIHHCQLPGDILIYFYFDEALQDINTTVVSRDWLIVLVNVNVNLSDLTADQVCAVKRFRVRSVGEMREGLDDSRA